MRYVIVSVIQGEAGKFNNQLRKKIYEALGARSSKLPAHFTIRAPFEYKESIQELDECLEKFARSHQAKPYTIKGYNCFDRRVVYMDVHMSVESNQLYKELINALENVSFMTFGEQDGMHNTFHVTVSSRNKKDIFDEIWEYVHAYPCDFACQFDNVAVYRWENETWELVRIYEFLN